MNIVWPFKTIQTSKELASIFQPSVIYIGLTPRPRQAYGAWVLSAIVFGLFDSHYQLADCGYQGFSPMKCGHANTVGLSRKKGMNSKKKKKQRHETADCGDIAFVEQTGDSSGTVIKMV